MKLKKKLALPDFTEEQAEAITNIGNPMLKDLGESDPIRKMYTKGTLEWLWLCELWCSPVLNPK